jgi:hypothetical protein
LIGITKGEFVAEFNGLQKLIHLYQATYLKENGSEIQNGLKRIRNMLLKGTKVKLSLCLTNLALRHEGIWGSGCIDLHFLDLGTS